MTRLQRPDAWRTSRVVATKIRLVALDVVTAAGGYDLFADSRKSHQLGLRFWCSSSAGWFTERCGSVAAAQLRSAPRLRVTCDLAKQPI